MIFIFKLYALIFGLLIGSFANVLIYRLPRGKSIVTPRSACPHCAKLIPWFENIPILSFLFLRGRCSGCKAPINLRYPFVELLIGVASYHLFPDVLTAYALSIYVFQFSIFVIFVSHFFIDLDHQILPDSLNIYLALLLLGFALIHFPWQHWVLGSAIGILFPLAVTWAFYLLRGKVGLGGGDIKLFGALGLYLGPFGIIQNIFLSCFLGAIVGVTLIALKKMDKDHPIPFGPYIIIVAVVQFYFPQLLIHLF